MHFSILFRFNSTRLTRLCWLCYGASMFVTKRDKTATLVQLIFITEMIHQNQKNF